MKIHISLFLLFLYSMSPCFSQQKTYEPLVGKTNKEKRILTKMEKRLEKDLETLPKKNRKALKEIFEERFDRTSRKLTNGHFLFQDSINQYLNQILTTILENNPDIPHQKDIQLFLSRYYWPNATCLGEGTLIFNIGLLRRLENESQVAFVIAHELAHFAMDHVNDAIHKRVQKMNSSQAKKLMKDMKRERYNANKNAEAFFKDVVFDDRKHSRLFEEAADSFAIVLLKNTPYDLKQGVRTLELLDKIDEEKYQKDLKLKERFHTEEYPFKKRWMMKETGLSMRKSNDFEWSADSLKTHPECQKRVDALTKLIPADYQNGQTDIQTFIDFTDLVRIADFEMVASSFELGSYSRSLYYCLQLLDEYPDNAWLHAMVGICFFEIYVAQEEHNLGNHVDLPSVKYKDRYRELVQFIHNLRLKDMAHVAYGYIQKNQDAFLKDEHYMYAMLLVADLMEMTDGVKALKKQYLEKYKKGRYRSHVKIF